MIRILNCVIMPHYKYTTLKNQLEELTLFRKLAINFMSKTGVNPHILGDIEFSKLFTFDESNKLMEEPMNILRNPTHKAIYSLYEQSTRHQERKQEVIT